MFKFNENLDDRIISAATAGDYAEIEKLIHIGANPNAVDGDGGSALIWASYRGNLRAVKSLLAYKAQVDLRDNDSETALSCAVAGGHINVLELLLDSGADPYIVNSKGWNALTWAASWGRDDVVKSLLDKGVDAGRLDGQGLTALSHALDRGRQKTADILAAYTAPKFAGYVSVNEQLASEKNQPQTILSVHLDRLSKMIGLNAVKSDVIQLVNFLRVQQLRKSKRLSVPEQSLHMVFTGNPGTGKTTIARLIAQIYKSMGILSEGQFVETDRAGLVGGYLGQTALKTQLVVESALGGVLFIDEAYSLTDNMHGYDMYGQEAVATLLKMMEDHRDDLIVIVAGYTEPMQKFIRSNPGLQSRFNKFLHFDDYAPAELTEIFGYFATQGDYKLHPSTRARLSNIFTDLYTKRSETFGNARLARNMFEKAINAHANRMVSAGAVDEVSLVTLYPEDVPNG